MTDVFISYKREERASCERIAQKLRNLSLDVWFDARLTAGNSFTDEIEREVRRAKCVLVLWSPGSVASRWVRNEADIGRERGVLAAAQLSPCAMPIEFRDIHHNALHDAEFSDDHPGWLRLLERIGELTARPVLADYSRAVGEAARPLHNWAIANPVDPLAQKARQISQSFTGLQPTPPPTRPPAKAPFPVGAVMITALMTTLVVGTAGASGWYYFANAAPLTEAVLDNDRADPAPPTSAARALAEVKGLDLVGNWNFSRMPDGCGPAEMVTVALGPDGLVVGGELQKFGDQGSDGWVSVLAGGSAQYEYRREADKLMLRLVGSDSVQEGTLCAS